MKKTTPNKKPPVKGRSGKATDGRKMTKKEARRILASGPKQDRNWLTSPNNPDSSPYWTPPHMKVDLTHASMLFMDANGKPIKDKFFYTGARVELGGEWDRLDIKEKNLKEDLEKAIDKVIHKHEKKQKKRPSKEGDDA